MPVRHLDGHALVPVRMRGLEDLDLGFQVLGQGSTSRRQLDVVRMQLAHGPHRVRGVHASHASPPPIEIDTTHDARQSNESESIRIWNRFS